MIEINGKMVTVTDEDIREASIRNETIQEYLEMEAAYQAIIDELD